MNFLAHYYFDRKSDPLFNLGLILPDLSRNFIKGGRLFVETATASNDNEGAILDGCKQHVLSDKIFHNWDGFKSLMNDVIEFSRSSSTPLRKDWFIAHIFVELVLDQYLSRTHTQLASELYRDFEQVNLETVETFLATNEIRNFEKFAEGFHRFMEVRYLEKYHKTDSILYALERICTKVKLPPFTDDQKDVLENIANQLLLKMPESVASLDRELS